MLTTTTTTTFTSESTTTDHHDPHNLSVKNLVFGERKNGGYGPYYREVGWVGGQASKIGHRRAICRKGTGRGIKGKCPHDHQE
jgi:hypothetical protein